MLFSKVFIISLLIGYLNNFKKGAVLKNIRKPGRRSFPSPSKNLPAAMEATEIPKSVFVDEKA